VSNDREKWDALQALGERGARERGVRELAEHLWGAAELHAPTPAVAARRYAQLVHAVARDWIRYATDTDRVGSEDIAGYTRAYAPPTEPLTLERPEDCDGKAVLAVALFLAAGMRARLEPRWHGARLDHVSAVVELDGRAVELETILSRARLGESGEQVPVEIHSRRWAYS